MTHDINVENNLNNEIDLYARAELLYNNIICREEEAVVYQKKE